RAVTRARGAQCLVLWAAGVAVGHSRIRFRGEMQRTRRRPPRWAGVLVLAKKPGDDLLSQEDYLQLLSARAVLTAVFGMGTGVSPPPWSPGSIVSSRRTTRTP